MPAAIVIGASSGIGSALCRHWRAAGWEVSGTFRAESDETRALRGLGVQLIDLDLASDSATFCLPNLEWQVLVLTPATMEPIGVFEDADFHAWADSLDVNCILPLQIIHALLPSRRKVAGRGRVKLGDARSPAVITFSGAGTNGPALNYSAYALSKVALVKAMELLDAEMPDVRFVSIAPGWVRTPIHDQTLTAGENAGPNLQRTRARLATDEGWTPMERVLGCVDWVLSQPREVVGGRNISVAHEPWDHLEFPEHLRQSSDLGKLRRMG